MNHITAPTNYQSDDGNHLITIDRFTFYDGPFPLPKLRKDQQSDHATDFDVPIYNVDTEKAFRIGFLQGARTTASEDCFLGEFCIYEHAEKLGRSRELARRKIERLIRRGRGVPLEYLLQQARTRGEYQAFQSAIDLLFVEHPPHMPISLDQAGWHEFEHPEIAQSFRAWLASVERWASDDLTAPQPPPLVNLPAKFLDSKGEIKVNPAILNRKIKVEKKKDSVTVKDLESLALQKAESSGFIHDVMKFNLSTAPKPQPWFALAGAIALTASLVGRKVRDEFDTRSNLLMLCSGYSSCGKDYARKVNSRVLEESGNQRLLGSEKSTSDTAIYRDLEAHPSLLLQIDEFGKFVAAAKSSKDSHLEGFITAITTLYTSADRRHFTAKTFADKKRTPDIVFNQPHLVLFAVSTQDAIYSALGDSSVENGFLGRCLVFESDLLPNLVMKPIQVIPESVKWFAEYWRDIKPPENDLADVNPEPIIVPTTVEANELYQALENLAQTQLERKAKGSLLWGRAQMKARQLGLVIACSMKPEEPVIDFQAADLACTIVRAVTVHMVTIATDWLASNEQEATQQKLLRVIKSFRGGITQSELTRKSMWLKARERNEILQGMVDCQMIRQEGTQPTRWFAN